MAEPTPLPAVLDYERGRRHGRQDAVEAIAALIRQHRAWYDESLFPKVDGPVEDVPSARVAQLSAHACRQLLDVLETALEMRLGLPR